MAIPQAQPVNPAAVPPVANNAAANGAANNAQAPAGVGAAATTLQPAAAPDAGAPAQSTGFCANISNAVAKCIETIRKWVAEHVPGFKWLSSTPANNQQPAPVQYPPAQPVPQTDAERVTLVKNPFLAGAAQPDAATVQVALDTFTGIQAPVAKLEAFQAVLNSGNCDQATGKRFYDALSDEHKTAFREAIWICNGRSDRDANGNMHVGGFGEFMVNNHIRTPLALQAAQNILDAARRAAPAPAAP